MAAPMLTNTATSKKSLKYALFSNFLVVLLIAIVTLTLIHNKSGVDIISSPLLVTKCLSVWFIFVHLVLNFTFHSPIKEMQKYKPSILLKTLGRGLIVSSVGVVLFHCLAVLFGAPFFDKTAETFHFAMLLASTTVLPAVVHLGPSIEVWIKVFIFQSLDTVQEIAVFYSVVCSLLGSWCGAAPIPLDWDRPWQAWPITCVLGAILGHCAGLLMATLYLWQQWYRGNKSKLV
ncbi:phosphatidylinositol-glycan biosynthesis class F protein-like [Dreissena polymorpha]|uniref:Phosphatidylinositol-glycan biosynthesis class F protein n=1 Tax=Dreissena polymorpha TaxID=45954 RepID=A0A9D4KY97_DREPO|nr:phosphatidylinositol-glycan biosynthesis class F protein-like [Dreissena polymorpha]KAH3848362.1 hypothetical protein DPMN_090723 [Dreissena polymorpha]